MRRLRPGARGTVLFGATGVRVVVIEDRGPLGGFGRQLVRVVPVDRLGDNDYAFEVPAAVLQRVFTARRKR